MSTERELNPNIPVHEVVIALQAAESTEELRNNDVVAELIAKGQGSQNPDVKALVALYDIHYLGLMWKEKRSPGSITELLRKFDELSTTLKQLQQSNPDLASTLIGTTNTHLPMQITNLPFLTEDFKEESRWIIQPDNPNK